MSVRIRLILPALASVVLLGGTARAGTVRVTARGEGVLRLGNSDLSALGLRKRVYVYTGNRAIDYVRTKSGLEVYAAPYDSLYDTDRSFLLSDRSLHYGGSSAPLRADRPTEDEGFTRYSRFLRKKKKSKKKVSDGPGVYTETVRVEEDQFYLSGMTEAKPGEEHWFYSTFLMPGRSLELTAELPGPMAPGPIILKVALRGCTDVAKVAPDHRVEVRFNGQKVGEMVWDGYVRREQSFQLPAGLVKAGANTVLLSGASLDGVPFDFVCADWVEVTYPRGLAAVGDRLSVALRVSKNQRIRVAGFSGSNVICMDVTDPRRPRWLALEVKSGVAEWVTTASGRRTYVLAGPSGRLAMTSSRAADARGAWRRGGHRYIVLSHADHMDAARRLVSLHGGRRGRARLYDARDAYDAFACGQEIPQALRALAQHHRPMYLCLVGDTSSDMKGRLGDPGSGLIPSFLVQGPHFEEPSDNLVGCLDRGDEYPEVAVGRIPARTAAEASTMVDKITARKAVNWGNYGGLHAAMVVGDNDQGIFEDGADEFAETFSWGGVEKIMFSDYGSAGAIRTAIIDGWKKSPKYFVYYGHAATNYLGKKKVLRDSNVSSLEADELPAGIVLCCLAGYFNFYGGNDSLAETLLKTPDRGLCALVAPSGMSAPEGQLILGREMSKILRKQPGTPLGRALIMAKRRLPAAHRDVLRSFNLLGDPALR